MRYFLLISLCLLCAAVSAQNKLTIVFNMNECSTCYNSLRHLKSVSPTIQFEFIFPERYRADSTQLIHKLRLEEYPAHYVWSDSMHKRMLFNDVFSAVHFSNSDQTQSFRFSLKNSLTAELVAYLNGFAQQVDTIYLEEPLITSGVKPLIYHGSHVYIRDSYKNGISKVNLITGKEEAYIPMTDTLARISFQKQFKEDVERKWAKSRSIISAYELRNYQTFKEIFIGNDEKIYALGEYTYFNISSDNADTIETRFYVLHTFSPQGKLLSTNGITQVTDESAELALAVQNNQIKDTVLYFYAASSLWVKDSLLSLDLIAFPSQDRKGGKQFFRGNFLLGPDDDYLFHSFDERQLPDVYEGYGNNLTNIKYTYDGRAFALPLADNLYSVHNPDEIIHLDFFDGKQYEGVPFEYKMVVSQVNQDRNHTIYTNYWLKEGSQFRYLKYNPGTGTRQDKLVQNQLMPEVYKPYIKTDYFDYNYLIVPIAPNQLLRFKVF